MAHDFRYVDQALGTMKKVEQYISAGMDTTIDVALDLIEHSGGNGDGVKNEIPKLEAIMIDYAEMERDLNALADQIKEIKGEVADLPRDADWPDFTNRLETRPNVDPAQLEKHEKFLELRQKIWDALHPDGEGRLVDADELGEDEDFALTQSEVNYKCPYTGKEMVNPMRNKLCKHNYDQEAVNEMFKSKQSVKCPITSCKYRNKPFYKKDLEENRELKKMIELKNRQSKRK